MMSLVCKVLDLQDWLSSGIIKRIRRYSNFSTVSKPKETNPSAEAKVKTHFPLMF